MADVVQADYESLTAVAKKFATESNEIRQLHGRLNRQVSHLRSAWVGRGSDAFFAEMSDKVLPAVMRLSTALAEADRVTKQIAELFQNAEKDGAAPFEQDAKQGVGDADGEGEGDAGDGASGDGTGGDLGTTGRDISSEVDDFGKLSDSILNDSGFGDSNDLGGDDGTTETGGDNDYTVPKDWLDGVKAGDSGAGGGGGDSGGGSGGGGDSGGGSGGGGDMGGGSGSGPSGSGSGSGEMGAGSGSGQSGGGMPMGQGMGQGMGTGASMPSAADRAAAVPGPLRYGGGASGMGSGGTGTPPPPPGSQGGGGGGAGAAKAAQGNAGLPMILTALGPLAALMGKAIKDRTSGK